MVIPQAGCYWTACASRVFPWSVLGRPTGGHMTGNRISKRITKRVVDSLKPSDSEYTIWDDALTGFGVRVRPSGAKSFVVVYRAGAGRKAPVRKVTLGSIGKLTPDNARILAQKTMGDVAHGKDPARDRAGVREGLT